MSSNNNIGTSRTAVAKMAEKSQSPRYAHGTTDDGSGIVNVGRLVTESLRSRHLRTLVGRNAPCPCGSLLKWKNCHGMPKPPPSLKNKKRPIISDVLLSEIDDEVT